MEIKNVTFVGLGVMGYNMAGHLKKNNFNTTVYNRTTSVAEKWINEFSGNSETTPGKASLNADIVFICVGRDEDLISVMAGFKRPKNVIFGDLPKTSTGKIQKFELRKKAKEI